MKQQEKFCPMSFNKDFSTMYCQPSCAWYTDAGCAIMVLATLHCDNLHELQDVVKTPADDPLDIPF